VPIPKELRDDLIEGAEVGYIVALGNKKLMRIK
jgi:translation initiation factor 5A